MASEDYCELCDLPKSQCVHGRPPAPPAAQPARKAPARRPAQSRTRATRTPTSRTGTSRTAASEAGAVERKPIQRRWTPPAAFEPHILAILQESGGELEAEELFAELETRVEDRLLVGDREKTPEGELRWRYAARRARQSLISHGHMTKGTPGLWKLA